MKSPWWIVIAGCVAHATNTGLSYFGLSAYFPALERDFGWSRTAISGAFSLAKVEAGLLGPLEGYATDRLGPRRIMFFGIGLMALGFLGLSMVNSLPTLYIAIVLGIVMGSSLGYNVPLTVMIANVFRERRSLAFGVYRMGPGVSGAFVPMVGWMIGLWGWRAASLASALILLVISLPLAAVIARIYKYHEVGDAADVESKAENYRRYAADPQLTLREALSSMSFWMLSVSMALRHMVTEGISVHFVILLVDRGWSTEGASGLLGVSALIGAPSRLGAAWLGDWFDKRRLMMGFLMLLSVSVLFMGWSSQAYLFTTFMVSYSLAFGGLASLQEPIRVDYFGTKNFASIHGWARLVTTAGTFMGPIVAGFFYDRTKSYALALTVFSLVSLLSLLCMFLAKAPPEIRQK
jgi:MFS family permease